LHGQKTTDKANFTIKNFTTKESVNTTRNPVNRDTRDYIREVQRDVRQARDDLSTLEYCDPDTVSLENALKDANTLLGATLTNRPTQRRNEVSTSTVDSILETAEALAKFAAILHDSHPVESTSLEFAGVSLVRSLRTIVQIDGDEVQLEHFLRHFDDLPSNDFSSWLRSRIAISQQEIHDSRPICTEISPQSAAPDTASLFT
jgi:hypothetical protein